MRVGGGGGGAADARARAITFKKNLKKPCFATVFKQSLSSVLSGFFARRDEKSLVFYSHKCSIY
jgi:hypothetical protein